MNYLKFYRLSNSEQNRIGWNVIVFENLKKKRKIIDDLLDVMRIIAGILGDGLVKSRDCETRWN